MFTGKFLALCAMAAAFTSASAKPVFKYKFNPIYAGGVDGEITVKYDAPDSTVATITADLDFTYVDDDKIREFDGNCTGGEVKQYKWHIHVNWESPETSQSYKECGLPITGNHYDPLKACGPNSEFAGTPECLPKTPNYACTPENYLADPSVCEKGDLSGKFGDFYLDDNYKVWGEWTDENFPSVKENTPTWNIILHAVCGKATPRIACAQIQRKKHHHHHHNGNNIPY